MRILHVVTKADVGGAQTHVLELATAQMTHGHDVSIAAGSLGPMAEEAVRRGLTVHEESSLRRELGGLAELKVVRNLGRSMRELAPDVVHAHSSKAGALARVAAKQANLPCVYTAHGWPFQAGAARSQRLVSWAGEAAMGHWWGEVICLTEAEAKRARRSLVVPQRRLHIVPNGLPDVPAELRADLSAHPSDRPVALVMVARFAPPKAQRAVLDALTRMDPAGWEMHFVGDGPEFDSVRHHGDICGLGDRVHFLGHRDAATDVLPTADIALLWSRYEGMPLALMEAMRAGLPCVANDLPGVRALFGEHGGLIAPFDTGALAETLTMLIGDARRRADLGSAARSRYEECFTIDRVERAVMDVYLQAVSARR